MNASTGLINIALSTPGTYTVTYTTAGTCTNTSTGTITINALDDASFSYTNSNYCAADSDPSATITGLAGGSFSSTAGLVFTDTSSGTIDLDASTPGTYTVTYTTSGTEPVQIQPDLSLQLLLKTQQLYLMVLQLIVL